MSLARLFVHNWQVKVVAFFLAVALWLYTSGQARIERTLSVHVSEAAVRALPPDYQVTSIAPSDFSVELDGPSALLGDLGRIEPGLEIAADALARGQQTFPIGERVLGLPADVRVRRIQPENIESITVSFGRITEEHLPVDLPELTDEPPGVSLSIQLDKNLVRVRGSQNVVDDLLRRGEKVRFEPVSLASVDPKLSETATLRLQLSPRALPGTRILDTVNAVITVEPRQAAQQDVQVSVGLLVPPDFFQRYRVELSQSQVRMRVRGPANLLQELQPSKDVVAYLNLLRGVDLDVPRDLKVTVVGPAWASFDEATVRCTVRVAATRTPLPAPAPETPPSP